MSIVELAVIVGVGIVAGLFIVGIYRVIEIKAEPQYVTWTISYATLDEYVENIHPKRWLRYFFFRSLPLVLVFSLIVGVYQSSLVLPSTGVFPSIAVGWFISALGQVLEAVRPGQRPAYRIVSAAILALTLALSLAIGAFSGEFDFRWIVPSFANVRDNLWAILFAAVILVFYFRITQFSGNGDDESGASLGKFYRDQNNGSNDGMPLKVERLIGRRVRKIWSQHGHTISTVASVNELEAKLLLSIVVYEDLNRPKIFRLLENVLVSCLPISMTVGIAQVWSSKRLNDTDSLVMMGEILRNLQDLADQQKLTGEQRRWFILEHYNHSEEYVLNVLQIYDHEAPFSYEECVYIE